MSQPAVPDFLQGKLLTQAERAGPVGQRLEDGSPEGQNLAKPGFGLRQPRQAQNRYTLSPFQAASHKGISHANLTRPLSLPAQNFFDRSSEFNSVSDVAQIFAMKRILGSIYIG
ncbi:hypothetical protein ALO95_200334 [Pseudomonas syringae pv. antirrhini]|nr:hypothetical protein ALO95_200334 [Pseudomonas syringae pv. antirrhini]